MNEMAKYKSGDRCNKLLLPAGSPVVSEMMALSTSTAPTTDSNSSSFFPDQQERALRDIQGRLLVVKRVLSAVKREPSNSSVVLPIGSSNESGGLNGNPCSALSPSDESAQVKRVERVSFHLSCAPTSKDVAGVTKRNEDRMIELLTHTSLSPSERKVRFQGKSKKSQGQINTSVGAMTMTYPSTLCNSGVNPKTRLPYPPPVRPLPLGERGSSPMAVEDNFLSGWQSVHTYQSTDRVVKHSSPKSIVDISQERMALFNPYEHPRLPDPPILTPTIRKKSRNGQKSSPQTKDFDHVIDDDYFLTSNVQSITSIADESISVMATTKSVFPHRQNREEKNIRFEEISESDCDAETLQCSNHWNSFPQPKKSSTKRLISKSASFSPASTSRPQLPPPQSRRSTINHPTISVSSTHSRSAVMELMPHKVEQQGSYGGSSRGNDNNMRRVKSDLHWKKEETRQYKPLNSL